MSEFPLYPNDDDEHAERCAALEYAIGTLTLVAIQKRSQAENRLEGTVADALKREADHCQNHASTLVDFLRELRSR